MLSIELAQRLKNAGLEWMPELHDFFVIPEASLEGRLFVLSDMQANLEQYRGAPVVTFHGALEWALDYILQQEVVWVPTEEQLREHLAALVPVFSLRRAPAGYTCHIDLQGQELSFQAASGCDAYGEALLHVLLFHSMREGAN